MSLTNYKNYNRNKYTFANINFIGKCNLDCFFCIGKDLEGVIMDDNLNTHFSKMNNLDKYLNLCKKHEIENVYLTGLNTDPLLYNHLEEFIDYLQEDKGFKVGIRTNALLAKNNIEVINKLKKSISYTILTLNHQVMKWITGSSKIPDFNYIFNNVNIPQRVSTVFSKFNSHEIMDIIRFVAKYPQVKYLQLRKISTDTRYDYLKKHMLAFEEFKKDMSRLYTEVGEINKAPIIKVNNLDIVFWKTVETSVNSINYFTNGVISENYFIIEGLLKNINTA